MRLIPAHAGKTVRVAAKRRAKTAHPRSRGENISGLFIDAAAKGSSPLTRGKPNLGAHLEVRLRLIPAHAGKTASAPASSSASTAHPRSRGENSTIRRTVRRGGGSSPLTRGKLPFFTLFTFSLRLIPAHAGKTRVFLHNPCCGWAHPRSRGENDFDLTALIKVLGSSPLTRGKPTVARERLTAPRLIPAHAGKTRTAWRCA